jgi:hypothetical protein
MKVYQVGVDSLKSRSRFKKELHCLFKEPRLSMVIRIVKLRWADRVARMEEVGMSRRLMYVQREGMRKVDEIKFERMKGCAGINELVGRTGEETSEGGQQPLGLVPPMMMMMIGSKKWYNNDRKSFFER